MITNDIKATEIETKIIKAANIVFLNNGINATTMSQIAKEAGISRTSLNYYFRSKKHLTIHVINDLEDKIVPTITNLIGNEELTIIQKIELFVDEYLTMVSQNPMVPNFILSELSHDPQWIIQLLMQRDLDFEKFKAQIDLEVSKGMINRFKMEDLFVTVMGLCVFPVMSKALLMEFFFNNNTTELNQFLDSRKKHVKIVLNSWLKKE